MVGKTAESSYFTTNRKPLTKEKHMKKTTYTLLALLVLAATGYTDQYVRPYTDKNNRYVPGHYRGEADGNPYNNRSYPGNQNPYRNY